MRLQVRHLQGRRHLRCDLGAVLKHTLSGCSPSVAMSCQATSYVARALARASAPTSHHAPDVAGAVVVGGHDHRAIQGNRQRAHRGANLWDQFAAARAGSQVPHSDMSRLVSCNRAAVGGRARATTGEAVRMVCMAGRWDCCVSTGLADGEACAVLRDARFVLYSRAGLIIVHLHFQSRKAPRARSKAHLDRAWACKAL